MIFLLILCLLYIPEDPNGEVLVHSLSLLKENYILYYQPPKRYYVVLLKIKMLIFLNAPALLVSCDLDLSSDCFIFPRFGQHGCGCVPLKQFAYNDDLSWFIQLFLVISFKNAKADAWRKKRISLCVTYHRARHHPVSLWLLDNQLLIQYNHRLLFITSRQPVKSPELTARREIVDICPGFNPTG